MSTRRSTSNRDAADAATTEEAQGQEVSGVSHIEYKINII